MCLLGEGCIWINGISLGQGCMCLLGEGCIWINGISLGQGCMCLAVIWHLHLKQNDQGLSHATAVTQGWKDTKIPLQ